MSKAKRIRLPLSILTAFGLLATALAPAVAQDSTNAAPGATASVTDTNQSAASSEGGNDQHNPTVVIGRDVEINAGETADTVVVIFGSAKIHGKVSDAVVAICGNIDVDGGEVGDAAVSILGSSTIRGIVHDAAVAILGDVTIKSGEVGDDAVAILGTVAVEDGAKVNGDTVAIGGTVNASEGAKIGGSKVATPAFRLPGVRKWIRECVFKFRPLSPRVGWVWVAAGLCFLVYLFVAAVLPGAVQACVAELERRPATTLLVGILAQIVLLLVFLLLSVTCIGLVAVPFIFVALLAGFIVGKVALLQWIGLGIGGRLGLPVFQRRLIGFLVGSVVVTVLYLVWVVGIVAFVLLGSWGLGVAIMAVAGGSRPAMKPQGRPAIPVPAPQAAFATMPAASFAGPSPAAANPVTFPEAIPVAPPGKEPPQLPVPVMDVLAYPKAGFWIRMGAALLDIILLAIIGGILGRPEGFLLAALAYFTGMLWWKGTTIGGIVLGLKVVRVDGKPVTIIVALVRALAAAFSVVVMCLGIFWIGWDREKQGWHDMIAGTVVLKMPRGTPLVCF